MTYILPTQKDAASNLGRFIFNIAYPMRGKDVYIVYEAAGIMIFDTRGTLIVEHNWPPPGIKYIGNGKPRGPKKKEVSPMS
jgi:hypothetical protein